MCSLHANSRSLDSAGARRLASTRIRHGFRVRHRARELPQGIPRLARRESPAGAVSGRRFRRPRRVRSRDLRAPPRLAENDARRGLGRHHVAQRVRGPRRRVDRARHLGRGVHRRPRARAAGEHGAEPGRADHHPLAHPSRSGATCPRFSTPTRSGARASPSPAPAPIWRASGHAPSIRAITSSSTGRRSGRRARTSPTGSSCSSAPIPTCPSIRGSAACLCR